MRAQRSAAAWVPGRAPPDPAPQERSAWRAPPAVSAARRPAGPQVLTTPGSHSARRGPPSRPDPPSRLLSPPGRCVRAPPAVRSRRAAGETEASVRPQRGAQRVHRAGGGSPGTAASRRTTARPPCPLVVSQQNCRARLRRCFSKPRGPKDQQTEPPSPAWGGPRPRRRGRLRSLLPGWLRSAGEDDSRADAGV